MNSGPTQESLRPGGFCTTAAGREQGARGRFGTTNEANCRKKGEPRIERGRNTEIGRVATAFNPLLRNASHFSVPPSFCRHYWSLHP